MSVAGKKVAQEAPPSELSIQPHPTVEYKFKQSAHEHLPKVPLRGILCGPSGQGKTVALVDLILRFYRGNGPPGPSGQVRP